MRTTRLIIAAAGNGTRMGKSYQELPKTLYSIAGKALLAHIFEKVAGLVDETVIVVSPAGKAQVETYLAEHAFRAALAIQQKPSGTANAVLAGLNAFPRHDFCDYLVMWGDHITLRRATLEKTLLHHRSHSAWLTFPTAWKNNPYIHILRDEHGNVLRALETREGDHLPEWGECDCGMFLIRGERLVAGLGELHDRMWDPAQQRFQRLHQAPSVSGEFHLLALIELWASQANHRVVALDIASAFETQGINTLQEAEMVQAQLPLPSSTLYPFEPK